MEKPFSPAPLGQPRIGHALEFGKMRRHFGSGNDCEFEALALRPVERRAPILAGLSLRGELGEIHMGLLAELHE